MSRIGKKPVKIPKGISVEVGKDAIKVTGGKSELRSILPAGITARVEGDEVHVERAGDTKELRSMHGLARALLANNVQGLSAGFAKELDLVGIGYRAQVADGKLHLSLGFSHPVEYQIPEGIQIKIDKQTHLVVNGADRQLVGQVAAAIRKKRPPEPYKGKGIRYSKEIIRKKAGKVGKTSA